MEITHVRDQAIVVPDVHSDILESAAAARIVVVVAGKVDEPILASHIQAMSGGRFPAVRLLGLCATSTQEGSMRRSLSLTVAFLRDAGFEASSRVECGPDWLHWLQADLREGDIVACTSQPHRIGSSTSIAETLCAELDVPVHILEAEDDSGPRQSRTAAHLVAWLGSLGIIAAFFLLQARIASEDPDLAGNIILLLSLPLEVLSIWVWNSLLG